MFIVLFILVIVIPLYENDIVLITLDQGGAEVKCNNNDIQVNRI